MTYLMAKDLLPRQLIKFMNTNYDYYYDYYYAEDLLKDMQARIRLKDKKLVLRFWILAYIWAEYHCNSKDKAEDIIYSFNEALDFISTDGIFFLPENSDANKEYYIFFLTKFLELVKSCYEINIENPAETAKQAYATCLNGIITEEKIVQGVYLDDDIDKITVVSIIGKEHSPCPMIFDKHKVCKLRLLDMKSIYDTEIKSCCRKFNSERY